MSGAAGLLQGAHALLALRMGPHWHMNEADSKAYALAWGNFLRHYPIGVTQKYVDAAALIVAIGYHEGPRLAITLRNRQARRTGAAAGPVNPFAGVGMGAGAQIFQFNPPSGAPANGSGQTQEPAQQPPPIATVEVAPTPDEAVH